MNIVTFFLQIKAMIGKVGRIRARRKRDALSLAVYLFKLNLTTSNLFSARGGFRSQIATACADDRDLSVCYF